MKVRCQGGKPVEAPKPVNYAEITGQGRVPYAKENSVATPKAAKGHVVQAEKRGMGAALRGGSFKCC